MMRSLLGLSIIFNNIQVCIIIIFHFNNDSIQSYGKATILPHPRSTGHLKLRTTDTKPKPILTLKIKTKRLQTSRDAVKGNFKRRVHIAPATHKRLFCMISVTTKWPRSADSVSNTVRQLQRAALNDLMTALLRKFSALIGNSRYKRTVM